MRHCRSLLACQCALCRIACLALPCLALPLGSRCALVIDQTSAGGSLAGPEVVVEEEGS